MNNPIERRTPFPVTASKPTLGGQIVEGSNGWDTREQEGKCPAPSCGKQMAAMLIGEMDGWVCVGCRVAMPTINK